MRRQSKRLASWHLPKWQVRRMLRGPKPKWLGEEVTPSEVDGPRWHLPKWRGCAPPCGVWALRPTGRTLEGWPQWPVVFITPAPPGLAFVWGGACSKCGPSLGRPSCPGRRAEGGAEVASPSCAPSL